MRNNLNYEEIILKFEENKKEYEKMLIEHMPKGELDFCKCYNGRILGFSYLGMNKNENLIMLIVESRFFIFKKRTILLFKKEDFCNLGRGI